MTVVAFEGPAGCGKTYRLIQELGEALRRQPLADHQRVAALTFMHGARRRLDGKLRDAQAVAGKYEAATVDSFAWRIAQRWQRLAVHLGHALPAQNSYTETCALAAALLQRQHVRVWVARSFPLVLVDEAQDLSVERSSIVQALAEAGTVLLAFDEFQCLNPALLPLPIEGWLRQQCAPIALDGNRRTNVDELITAARAVRNGQAVNRNGNRFKVIATPGSAQAFAATCLASAIRWRNGGGTVAVLTPSRRGGFADDAVARVKARPIGDRQYGPFNIVWESSEDGDASELWGRLGIGGRCTVDAALAAIAAQPHDVQLHVVRDWVIRQRNALGVQELDPDELRRQLGRAFALRRRFGQTRQPLFSAMTIQQAKNREFDHVVVLWPYTVPNNDEQRRRLLYNAITRAKRSCTVLVQAQPLLNEPPFVPRAAQQ